MNRQLLIDRKNKLLCLYIQQLLPVRCVRMNVWRHAWVWPDKDRFIAHLFGLTIWKWHQMGSAFSWPYFFGYIARGVIILPHSWPTYMGCSTATLSAEGVCSVWVLASFKNAMVLEHQLKNIFEKEMFFKKGLPLHLLLGTENWHDPLKIHIGWPLWPQHVKL